MVKVYKMTEADKLLIGGQSREWAVKTFSVDSIGKQWEALFDAMPPKDWSSITLEYKSKNVSYPMPTMTDNEVWVKALYNNILLVEPDPDGLKYWLNALATNMKREQVYQYFISVGHSDNAKNAKPVDFGDQFDKNDKKRVLVVMKESGGDLFVLMGCFKGLKELYPDADLYVACDPAFNDILASNEYVHKLLPYHPVMESELAMMAHVDYYYYPALPTQRQLAYLTKDKIGLDLGNEDAVWGVGTYPAGSASAPQS